MDRVPAEAYGNCHLLTFRLHCATTPLNSTYMYCFPIQSEHKIANITFKDVVTVITTYQVISVIMY